MDGTKLARIRCCNRCEHRIQKHADHAGPRGFSVFCTAGTGQPLELHDDFMEGPAENCPHGKWSGLDPVGPRDPQEWQEWNEERKRQKRIEGQRRGLKPVVKVCLADQPIKEVDRRLEELVVEHGLEPEVATEIGNELDPH
mgnify:CR=1 FL=1